MSRGRWLAIVILLAGCDAGSATLIVQVRTDLTPGTDFTEIIVSGSDTSGAHSFDGRRQASVASTWGTGVRVTEQAELPLGEWRLRVGAHNAAGEVVSRPVRVELLAGVHVVTVLLTGDCAGVECPGAGGDPLAVACLAGRCARDECTEETPELCPDAECATDGDCVGPTLSCVERECAASGVCFDVLDAMACTAPAECTASAGCATAGGTLGLTCAGDIDCDGGQLCEAIWGESRCYQICPDAMCEESQLCVDSASTPGTGICVGDDCDPVSGGGCGPDRTCGVRAYDAFPPSGMLTDDVASCRPIGTVAAYSECSAGEQCVAATHCAADPTGTRTCAGFCRIDNDCSGNTCIEHPLLVVLGYGICSAACDPFGTPCADGLDCIVQLEVSMESRADVWVSQCASAGPRDWGAMCARSDQCMTGMLCFSGFCAYPCDLGAPACGPSGSCNALSPATKIADRDVGVCF